MTDASETIRETILPPLPDTFMGHHLAGRDPGDVDDWIDRWHDGPSTLQLHQFLGMTWEEYGNFVLAPKCLPGLIANRRIIEEARIDFLTLAARNTERSN